jgi:hypothetical protein
MIKKNLVIVSSQRNPSNSLSSFKLFNNFFNLFTYHLVKLRSKLTMDVFFGIFVICALFGNVLGEEQQCSRYHYEAQTLERVIKAEFTIAELKNKIDVYQSKITDDHSKLEQRVELIQKAMNKVIENVSNFFAFCCHS